MAPARAAASPIRRARSRWDPPTPWTSFDTRFDDTHAIANAGLLLAATLAERLGIQQAADALIDPGERAGAAPTCCAGSARC
jgi:hypothetical protein